MFQAIDINAIVCCPLLKDGRLTAMMAVHQGTGQEGAIYAGLETLTAAALARKFRRDVEHGLRLRLTQIGLPPQ